MKYLASLLACLCLAASVHAADLVDPSNWGSLLDPFHPAINDPLGGGILRTGWTTPLDPAVEMRGYLSFDVSQLTPGAANYYLNLVMFNVLTYTTSTPTSDISISAYADDGLHTVADWGAGTSPVGVFTVPTVGFAALEVTNAVNQAIAESWPFLGFSLAPGWAEADGAYVMEYGYPGWDSPPRGLGAFSLMAISSEPSVSLSVIAQYDISPNNLPEPSSIALLAAGGSLLLRRRR